MTTIERIVESVSKAVESALGVSLLDIIVQISATIILIVIIRAFFWKKSWLTSMEEKKRWIRNYNKPKTNIKSQKI